MCFVIVLVLCVCAFFCLSVVRGMVCVSCWSSFVYVCLCFMPRFVSAFVCVLRVCFCLYICLCLLMCVFCF